jgi:HEAT repeat protein
MKKQLAWTIVLIILLTGTAASWDETDDKLLRDPNPETRMKAALAQVKAQNGAAVPVLIDLLAILPSNKRAPVEDALRELAGEWAPGVGPAADDEISRRIRRDTWAAWWANTDGPALLSTVRKHTLTPSDVEKVRDTIRRLGAKNHVVREKAVLELVSQGRLILPLLHSALKDRDLEIVRGARRCLQRIEEQPANPLPTAALRLLALRRPQGTVEALLAYLPFVLDEDAQETVVTTLTTLGVRDGKADKAIVAALTDKEPVRRAAAAMVVSKAGPDQRKALGALLADPDPKVRFQVASSLLRVGDKRAVPALVALLDEGPQALAWQAEDLLHRLASDQVVSVSVGAGDEASRRKARAAWEAWWKTNEGKVDLTKANLELALRGFTVISEHDQAGNDGLGKIWECGKDGKPRWQIVMNLGGPMDVQFLPGGKLLISEYKANRVTERDREGKILWEKKTNTSAISCQRLPNGNTLIGTLNEIFEVTRDGRTVYTLPRDVGGGSIWCAQKLRNGHILYVQSNGEVVEATTAGKRIHAVNVGGTQGWGGVELLANGRLLVAKYNANQVVEIDWAGKVHWQAIVAAPAYSTRLPNGNTLATLTNNRGIVEIDRTGKVIWQQGTQGRPFRVRRY